MIYFERTSRCSVEFTGPAAELRAYGADMRRTGAVMVDLDLACTQGELLFPSWSPFLALLPPVGATWADEGPDSRFAVDLALELEREEAYRDWAEQRFAAARGLA